MHCDVAVVRPKQHLQLALSEDIDSHKITETMQASPEKLNQQPGQAEASKAR